MNEDSAINVDKNTDLSTKLGVDHPTQNHAIFCKARKKFEYQFEGKTHRYFPDFYELKGAHFFKDGKMMNSFDRTGSMKRSTSA